MGNFYEHTPLVNKHDDCWKIHLFFKEVHPWIFQRVLNGVPIHHPLDPNRTPWKMLVFIHGCFSIAMLVLGKCNCCKEATNLSNQKDMFFIRRESLVTGSKDTRHDFPKTPFFLRFFCHEISLPRWQATQIFLYVHPNLGREISIFQMGWFNHQIAVAVIHNVFSCA